jgi:hypothetical protein
VNISGTTSLVFDINPFPSYGRQNQSIDERNDSVYGQSYWDFWFNFTVVPKYDSLIVIQFMIQINLIKVINSEVDADYVHNN